MYCTYNTILNNLSSTLWRSSCRPGPRESLTSSQSEVRTQHTCTLDGARLFLRAFCDWYSAFWLLRVGPQGPRSPAKQTHQPSAPNAESEPFWAFFFGPSSVSAPPRFRLVRFSLRAEKELQVENRTVRCSEVHDWRDSCQEKFNSAQREFYFLTKWHL